MRKGKYRKGDRVIFGLSTSSLRGTIFGRLHQRDDRNLLPGDPEKSPIIYIVKWDEDCPVDDVLDRGSDGTNTIKENWLDPEPVLDRIARRL